MSAQTVDAAKAVSLIDQVIALTEKKKVLLVELRDAIIREHGHGEDFPRPMGVRASIVRHGTSADCPGVQSGHWTRCLGHKTYA